MISVYFGNDTKAVVNIDAFFRHTYSQSWFDDDVVKQMVKDVDSSEVVSSHCIISPVLGQIAPEYLSGGVKTLICLWKMDDFLVDLITCGNNCCKWLSYIAMHKNIRVSMSGYELTFRDKDRNYYPISGICENDSTPIKDGRDWCNKMCLLAGEPENER